MDFLCFTNIYYPAKVLIIYKTFIPLPKINLTAMSVLYKIVKFYVEGFCSMTVGKTLWIIICIKLFIMFAVLKVFFFPDFLKTNFENDTERSEYIIHQLTENF